MKKILFAALCLVLTAASADAKHYVITVENNTRAPVNWDAFVTRAGGEVVETYDFIDGALLDLPEEQAQRLMDRRAPGMTIEEDFVINWIKGDSSALKTLNGYSGAENSVSAVPSAAPVAPLKKAVKVKRYIKGKY